MILKDFLPNMALKEFVRCYRIVHLEFDESAEFPFKIYTPKPETCLSFCLREREEIALKDREKEDYPFSVGLFGQQTSITKRYAGKRFFNFQIVFQPTALFRLTGIPAEEFTNKYIDAESVFSKNIAFFLEELQEAKSYDEMLFKADIFVGDLIKNARKESHPLDNVSRLMMLKEGRVSVDWLAKESNLCAKQFKRKFHERTGINPKIYHRIIRFNKAYNLKNAHPGWDWLKVAIECDYYDYQHLVKDYHHFTGLNPNQLHQIELSSPESRLGLAKDLYRSRIKPLYM